MVLGSGPDGRTKYFYLSAENASNTGFWAGGKHLAALLDHVISQKSMLTIFQKSLLLWPGRELAPLSLLNKSQNYCSTLSTTLLRYQQLVMNFQPSEKTVVCRPLPPFCFFPRGKYISWCSVHHSGTSDDDKCTL